MNKDLRRKISIIAITALVGQVFFMPIRSASAEAIANSQIELQVDADTEENVSENTEIDEADKVEASETEANDIEVKTDEESIETNGETDNTEVKGDEQSIEVKTDGESDVEEEKVNDAEADEENKAEDAIQENDAEESEEEQAEEEVPSEKEAKAGALQYALFSGNESNDLIYSGWKMTVNGDIHTNSNFVSNCSELYVNGKCEAADDITLNGWIKDVGEEVKCADLISMSDISSKISDHINKETAQTYESSNYFSEDTVNLEKDIIVNGDATFGNTNLIGSGFVVAENNISFNLNEFKNNSDTSACYYSKNGDIVINANNSEINGILYAPHGKVIFNGYNLKINGRIIADQIVLNGSLININASDSDLDVFDKEEEKPDPEDKPTPGDDKPYTEFGGAKEEDGVIELTPLEQYKMGGIWYDDSINTTNGFEVNFEYWAGGGREYYYGGADGIVVSLADAKRLLGTTSGGTLSFNGEGTYGVEFDSYQNEIDPEYWIKGFKHIAIIKDSVSNHLVYKVDDRVDDSQWHKVKVVYKENNLYVYLDGEEVLQHDEIELNDNIFVGISGSTGESINRQLIKNVKVESYNK